jgi:ribosome biogenesis GTPase A
MTEFSNLKNCNCCDKCKSLKDKLLIESDYLNKENLMLINKCDLHDKWKKEFRERSLKEIEKYWD